MGSVFLKKRDLPKGRKYYEGKKQMLSSLEPVCVGLFSSVESSG